MHYIPISTAKQCRHMSFQYEDRRSDSRERALRMATPIYVQPGDPSATSGNNPVANASSRATSSRNPFMDEAFALLGAEGAQHPLRNQLLQARAIPYLSSAAAANPAQATCIPPAGDSVRRPYKYADLPATAQQFDMSFLEPIPTAPHPASMSSAAWSRSAPRPRQPPPPPPGDALDAGLPYNPLAGDAYDAESNRAALAHYAAMVSARRGTPNQSNPAKHPIRKPCRSVPRGYTYVDSGARVTTSKQIDSERFSDPLFRYVTIVDA